MVRSMNIVEILLYCGIALWACMCTCVVLYYSCKNCASEQNIQRLGEQRHSAGRALSFHGYSSIPEETIPEENISDFTTAESQL